VHSSLHSPAQKSAYGVPLINGNEGPKAHPAPCTLQPTQAAGHSCLCPSYGSCDKAICALICFLICTLDPKGRSHIWPIFVFLEPGAAPVAGALEYFEPLRGRTTGTLKSLTPQATQSEARDHGSVEMQVLRPLPPPSPGNFWGRARQSVF
jgi:hypothetical protein